MAVFLLFVLALLFVWHHWSVSRGLLAPAAVQASYGAGFALCGVFLLGLLARLGVTSFPAVWRTLTVLLGAGLAALEIALQLSWHALFCPVISGGDRGVSGFHDGTVFAFFYFEPLLR